MALPEGYNVLTPIEYQRANNPPQPGCVTMYVAQVSDMFHFVLPVVSINHPWKISSMFSRRDYVLGNVYVKNPRLMGDEGRLTDAGLFEHGFKVKALLEIELLVVVGLHFVVDNYDGPESLYSHLQTMMNRAAILNFIPDNIPSNPLSSSGTRSASATPSDVPLSSRTQSQSKTLDALSAIPMRSASP
ncbi:hypothetical protein Salat_2527700 [Sesamum alatum]|uniref:Uncharacterized protein n=1 Tax=Sesamum alatum TaxID=300844 RepID=A0AAE1XS83_9LAMI|nr:hypothetical protein Salat_2527700 [Sesamum alatum]